MNATVCDYTRDSFDDIVAFTQNANQSVVLPILLLCLGIPAAFCGYLLIRPVAASGTGLFAFYTAFYITFVAIKSNCVTAYSISLVSAFIGACLSLFLYKFALFALGASAFASVVFLLFSVVPELHNVIDIPNVFYWICLVCAGIVGGLILRFSNVVIIQVVTAVLGGVSCAYGTHGLFQLANVIMSHWVYFSLGVVLGILGFACQRLLRKLKRRRVEQE